MDHSGGGDLSKTVHVIEENVDEKHRRRFNLPFRRQKQTGDTSEKTGNELLNPTDQPISSATSISHRHTPSGNSSADDLLRRIDSKAVEVKDAPEGDAIYDHLPEHEKEILKRQVDIPDVTVTYGKLFRYATRLDLFLYSIAAITAIGGGAALPLMTIIFGNLSNAFKDYFLGTLTEPFNTVLTRYVVYFIYLAIAEFALVYVSTVLFIYVGEKITSKVREEYLKAILRQNIGFFDKLGAGEITTRITSDTSLIQEAISEKVGGALNGVAAFFAAFIIGFARFWKLTLICCSSIVAILFAMGTCGAYMSKWNKLSLDSYAKGGSIAEEVLASIRNAVAFGTQDRLAEKYDIHLVEARHWGFRGKSMLSSMIGLLLCLIYLTYALAFWMGSRYLLKGEIDLAKILTIILSIVIGAFSFGNIGPNVQSFAAGVAASAKIYGTIDRISPLDTQSDEGERLENVEGTVELQAIRHIYPSRPEVVVMDGVDLVVPAGKTTALVGASGSGKSTIVGLVERFYDPVGGKVLLDGHDISTLNLRWLRQQIALVQQEPVLFSLTIKENIRNGLVGSRFEHESEDDQMARIVEAAKKANAHDFITQLPLAYETHVGERGFLLSGGQKQRVAIARAIVSDPKILLLDEATSALDTKSEGVVQAALDEAAKGRTTIVIAHRLSTIKTADNIVVMKTGCIVEQGTHDELLAKEGAYFNLVSAQRIEDANNDDDSDDEDDPIEQELDRIHTQAALEERTSTELTALPIYDDKVLALARDESLRSVAAKAAAARARRKNEKQYSLWTLFSFILSFNRREWVWMSIGIITTIIAGAGPPVGGVFFSKAVVSLSQFDRVKIRSDIDFWCWMYFMLALVLLFAMVVQGTAFSYCSELLVHRARDLGFRYFMRQDIAFFDEDENSTGALTAFLSTEATRVASLSGATLGTILNCITTIVVSCAIGLAVGWKLAVVCMCALPVILGTGYFRFWSIAKFSYNSQQAYKASAGYACEHTNAIRTVVSLTTEAEILEDYQAQLKQQLRVSTISTLKLSTMYAASQSMIFLAFALGFWYGGTLVSRNEYTLQMFFIVFTEIIFGMQSAGTVFSFAGDMSKAKNAARELKRLWDRKPSIDPWSDEGKKVYYVRGQIEFRDVRFRYPTRPAVPVLRGLNMTIEPGEYVALVGASGCGKSTTIALMERFYDPLWGGIYVDGREISSLNLNDYRSFIALVSQEPTLYQGSIRDNILLGMADKDAPVDEEKLITVCKEANIYDFIMSLPEGFDTPVGSKAALLSGGQKQRIAIARALLRDPKILLLDEATSALDSESEKVVQAALDRAAAGRTTIAVAHRLSTIQKADRIFVFDKGKIVESGTHAELMHIKGGRYSELVNLQSLEKQH